jgi:transposase
MLPLASIVVSANQNEKKHSLALVEKAKDVLAKSGAKLRSVIADSQYSDKKLRNVAPKSVIPYPAHHKRDVHGLFRVDRKFRTYGPKSQIKQYHKRPYIEAAYSFLKTQYSLANNKVRGTRKVSFHAFYSLLCLVLVREAALKLGRKDKAKSPTYFNS